ncbi:LOW QUALITY PROTEIN: hypothetical protein PHMEG_000700 [Phytophthora megakarya]|uniref:Peptidase A2 domain-containing protein n=1 Tax=Phytophthora megakarya TaxID=4795 RepID=A0A225X3F0_9STRA|nr:LOW QUALITY PROTEIN: hypothetical protein PHMEG_000700 [Phytophthora megakarya]
MTSLEFDWDRLRWFANQVVSEATLRVEDYYPKNVVRIWQSLCSRASRGETRAARRRKRRAFKTTVCFDCSSLYGQHAETLADIEFRTDCDDDVSHYVNIVSAQTMGTKPPSKTCLVELNADDYLETVEMNPTKECIESSPVVCDGRRVCLPVRMLADTGATLSLMDSFYCDWGRLSIPCIRMKDGLDSLTYPIRNDGAFPRSRYCGQTPYDAIQGMDALGVFGALIDVAKHSMLLQRSGETLPLGLKAIEDSYLSTTASSVRLSPLDQALARTSGLLLRGRSFGQSCAEFTAGVGCPPIARALLSLVRESVFSFGIGAPVPAPAGERIPTGEDVEDYHSVAATTEEKLDETPETIRANNPIVPDLVMGVKAGFTNSDLSEEQKELFQSELDRFGDMFVESSKKPGRTDLLKFEINTGNGPPKKCQPYREVTQQYLDLGFIRGI